MLKIKVGLSGRNFIVPHQEVLQALLGVCDGDTALVPFLGARLGSKAAGPGLAFSVGVFLIAGPVVAMGGNLHGNNTGASRCSLVLRAQTLLLLAEQEGALCHYGEGGAVACP